MSNQLTRLKRRSPFHEFEINGSKLVFLRSCKEGGFTLIELLIAIAIVSILMSMAVMNIPNHDERNWTSNTNHLVALMNTAHEESLLNGRALNLRIDEYGWNFYYLDSNGFKLSQGVLNALPQSLNESLLTANQSNGLADIYKSQTWSKPVVMSPVEIVLGEDLFSTDLAIKISQGEKKVTIHRNRYGQFTLVRE